ncbi:unnamed protein product [Didymodactylos carnosus]|uniref:DUF7920 domain-containing protein n=1 Tax=Didymodactylos carnosus TaxID=1234261 RepID=A0A813QF93_9BILA|nr:unnamed protein product [Didymodactylos carnosus]CAF0766251.1 unnamed protein product [Didymodactylos carnosus]CAF3540597.1 unnamed protein product [Didymodactylos carnosus]CAF3547664.1 unnamed protein product [Didymodactylos carnosus]
MTSSKVYTNDSPINFDSILWSDIWNYLFTNLQLKRNNNENLIELKTHLTNRISMVQRELSKPTSMVNDYLQWVRSHHKNIKMVTKPIPLSILGSNVREGELIDVRISCRGPDDKYYDRDPLLRQRLPRGCTLINCDLKDEKDKRLDFGLFALRKFTGGLGDDDDRQEDNRAWLNYFLIHPHDAKQIICTQKINGEAAHLSCFSLNNRLILCAGSKNVHLCFRNHSDIDLYGNDVCYSYASSFCHTILNTLSKMSDHGAMLLNFLCETRYTAIFEILNYAHQHVVNLEYLKDSASELKFITFSEVPQNFDSVVTNLCSLPPDYSIEIARCLHLSTTNYDIIENKQDILNEYLLSIKYRHECEGSVLYFLDDNDRVVGLLKKKTIWYVILRAIREKTRPMCSHWEKSRKMDLSETLSKTEKRLCEIQGWLKYSDEILKCWTDLACQFIKWLSNEIKKKTISVKDISDHYPIVWTKFLNETNSNDNFMTKYMNNLTSNDNVWKQLNEIKTSSITTKDQYTSRQGRKTKQPSGDVTVADDDNVDINVRSLHLFDKEESDTVEDEEKSDQDDNK